MPKRIRVEGMSITTTPEKVLASLNNFGPVVSCHVERDAAGGATGVAHVEFESTQSGAAAIATLNNTPLDGATIVVREDP